MLEGNDSRHCVMFMLVPVYLTSPVPAAVTFSLQQHVADFLRTFVQNVQNVFMVCFKFQNHLCLVKRVGLCARALRLVNMLAAARCSLLMFALQPVGTHASHAGYGRMRAA